MKHHTIFSEGEKHAKVDKRHFHYISKKQFKGLQEICKERSEELTEPVIIGSTKLNPYDDEKARKSNKKQCDFILELNGFKYKGFKKKKGRLKGYLDIGEGNYIQYCGLYPFFLIPLFIGLMILLLLLNPKPNTPPRATGDDWNGEIPIYTEDIRAEYIEVPGYSKLGVSKTSPEIPLINMDGNTVYLKYIITENNIMIYESDYIRPGAAIKWNAYEALSSGTHRLTFKTQAVDIDTGEECNGTSQQATITRGD